MVEVGKQAAPHVLGRASLLENLPGFGEVFFVGNHRGRENTEGHRDVIFMNHKLWRILRDIKKK